MREGNTEVENLRRVQIWAGTFTKAPLGKCPPDRLVFCNACCVDEDGTESHKDAAEIKPGTLLENVMLFEAIVGLVTGLCPLSCPVAGNACGDVFR